MFKPLRGVIGSAALALAVSTSFAQELPATSMAFHIEPQFLPDALNAWARQAGVQLVWRSNESGAQQIAPRVVGAFSPQKALQALLHGSGFTYSLVDDETVAVRPARQADVKRIALFGQAGDPPRKVPLVPASERDDVVRIAQGRPVVASSQSKNQGDREELEEVVVTGTHIRGRNAATSNVITIDRSDIVKSGFGNTSQIIASLPQNFGGGASPNVNSNVNRGGSELNQQLGTGVNLRGLGTGATLTLLNGHRLAPAGEGSFVDVSLIPVSLIEKVEILTDGASAIYGSDAVAGVVNIITREGFDGSETSARFGSVTRGDRDEYAVSHLYGKAWEDGGLTLNFEHNRETSLATTDRSFASAVPAPSDLLPSQRTNSAFASVRQSVASNVKISSDFLYTDREYDQSLTFSGSAAHHFGHAIGLAASAGVDVEIGQNWLASVTGSHSRNTSKFNKFQPDASELGVFRTKSYYETSSVEGRADGPLFHLPAGTIQLALGAAYRAELSHVGSGNDAAPVIYRADRSISSVYAELRVPVFGSAFKARGLEELDVTLAGRFDRYSDFGSTTNPKFGVAWVPLDGVIVRGTYSESYRAPPFRQVITPAYGYLIDVPDPQSERPDGLTTSILVNGGNSTLSAETSSSKSFGIAFNPVWAPNFRAELSYFDISYEDRIVDLLADNFFSFLENEAALSEFVLRDPGVSFVRSLIGQLAAGIDDFNQGILGRTDADQIFVDYEVGAYFDGRYNNVATSRTRGFDLQLRHHSEFKYGYLDLQLLGSYLSEYSIRASAAVPEQELLNTAFHPIDLRLRGGATWGRGNLSISAFVNYVDSYGDPGSFYSSAGTIASWTTVDLQLGYEWQGGETGSWIDGTRVSLSALNALDKDPPALNATPFQLGYDAENANPLGRFLALSVTKRW